jgi:arylsulfatase A-like enzyme
MAERMTWEDWAERIRYYYAYTTLIDQQIGRMIHHLDEAGLRDNTIIIFVADHGETLGTHGGLTGKGWNHFEEIQRIPFIVWLPERYRADEGLPGVADEWVSLIDVYPTVLDYAGVDSGSHDVPGRSLAPLLRGESVEWRDRAFVEFRGLNSISATMVSVRIGDLKYGWNCTNWDELYNLAEDPHEMHNLIHDPAYGKVVLEMREALEAWMAETRYPGAGLFRSSRLGRYR